MPFTDLKKKEEWQKRHNKKRREQRAAIIAERERKMGYHTKASLSWKKKMLTNVQTAWIAACIDCEGCLSLGSYWNKTRNSYNFHVNASVQMTDKSIPEKLYELCGGHLYYDEREVVKHKSVWQWHLSSNGLRWLLPQILDDLLVKRKQAELLLEFLTISKRGVSTRAEYNKRAQEIRLEMKYLNQRGIPTNYEGKTKEPLIDRNND